MDQPIQEKCKFCDIMLIYGIDKDSMVHCQYCHMIWDGFAQCTCGEIDIDETKNN